MDCPICRYFYQPCLSKECYDIFFINNFMTLNNFVRNVLIRSVLTGLPFWTFRNVTLIYNKQNKSKKNFFILVFEHEDRCCSYIGIMRSCHGERQQLQWQLFSKIHGVWAKLPGHVAALSPIWHMCH